MKSNIKKKCLSFICSASLVTGLTVSPAGSVFGYTAGFTVYAEGEAEGETIKTEAMGIFLTLLLGSGIRFVGSFADQAKALGEQFDQWVAETQATITAGTIVAGAMFQNGWMKLTSDVTNAYNSFSSWLVETLSIPATGDFEMSMSGSVSGTGSFVGTGLGNSIKIGTYEGNDVFLSADEGVAYRIYLQTGSKMWYSYGISTTRGARVSLYTNNGIVLNNVYTLDGYTYYTGAGSANRQIVWDRSYDFIYDGLPATIPWADMVGELAPNDQILTGESLDLKDGIGLDQDQALLYDISALAEYAGVLDQTLTDAQDLVGVLTDAIARSKADADEDEDEDAEVLPWDLVDSDTDSKVAPDDITDVPPNDTAQYKVLGLEKIFPFSIPFDIYYFIKMFNAPAQALEFDLPLVVHGLVNETYHVDLSMFDPVAVVFRLMMLVTFVWFLITKTRDFLRS